jgi:hypothetical protein
MRRLVSVPLRTPHKDQGIGKAKNCKEPVKVIHMTAVEVVADPPPVGITRDFSDNRHQETAHKTPHRHSAEVQRIPQAAHGVRRLVQEKLHLAHTDEHFADPSEHILRQQPEDRHGHLPRVQHPTLLRHSQPPHLHSRCHRYRHTRQYLPHPNPLQQRQPPHIAREAPHERHEILVVQRQHNTDCRCNEQRHRRCRYLKAPPHVPVHRRPLVQKQRPHLRKHRRKHQIRPPNRQHPHQQLHLLNLRHSAQLPWTHSLHLSLITLHRCLVQKTATQIGAYIPGRYSSNT